MARRVSAAGLALVALLGVRCSPDDGPRPTGQSLLLITVCGLRVDRLVAAVEDGSAPMLAQLRKHADVATSVTAVSTECLRAHREILLDDLQGCLVASSYVEESRLVEDHYPAAAVVSRSELYAAAETGFELDSEPEIEPFRIDLIGPEAARLRLRRTNEATTEAALAWLRRATTPFFLWVQLEGLAIEIAADESELEASVRRRMLEIDRAVGRLLEELRRGDRDRRTVVVLTADHGEALGGAEGFGHRLAAEGVARVPLWIADPSVDGEAWPKLRSFADFRVELLRRLAPRAAVRPATAATTEEPERDAAGTRYPFLIERGELPLDDASARAVLPILRSFDLTGPVLGRVGEMYAAALYGLTAPSEQDLAERRDFVTGRLPLFVSERHPFASTLYARGDLVPGIAASARLDAAKAAVRGAPWYFPAVRALASVQQQSLQPHDALETLMTFGRNAPLSPTAREEFQRRFAGTIEKLRPK